MILRGHDKFQSGISIGLSSMAYIERKLPDQILLTHLNLTERVRTVQDRSKCVRLFPEQERKHS